MSPTVKLEAKLDRPPFVEARGPMTAAHLVSAGWPVLAVSVQHGRPVYLFDRAANNALFKYLDTLNEMRVLAERASRQEHRHAPPGRN